MGLRGAASWGQLAGKEKKNVLFFWWSIWFATVCSWRRCQSKCSEFRRWVESWKHQKLKVGSWKPWRLICDSCASIWQIQTLLHFRTRCFDAATQLFFVFRFVGWLHLFIIQWCGSHPVVYSCFSERPVIPRRSFDKPWQIMQAQQAWSKNSWHLILTQRRCKSRTWCICTLNSYRMELGAGCRPLMRWQLARCTWISE